MKLKTLSLLILVFLFHPSPGAEAEGPAPDSATPAFQIAMVLDAASPDSLQSLKAAAADPAPSKPTTKTLPQLLEGDPPPYPEIARRSRAQGSLRVVGIIDPQGRLQELQVDGNQSDVLKRFFKAATIEAVRDWKFSPGTVNGQVVPVSFRLTVRFKLIDPSKRISRGLKPKRA